MRRTLASLAALALLCEPAFAQTQWWLYHREQGCVRPPVVQNETLVPETLVKSFPKCFVDKSDAYGKGPWTFVNCFQESRIGLGFFYFEKQSDCRSFARKADDVVKRKP